MQRGFCESLTNRIQPQSPASPVDSTARRVVCGVAIDVASDADRAMPEQVGAGFDVYAGLEPADPVRSL